MTLKRSIESLDEIPDSSNFCTNKTIDVEEVIRRVLQIDSTDGYQTNPQDQVNPKMLINTIYFVQITVYVTDCLKTLKGGFRYLYKHTVQPVPPRWPLHYSNPPILAFNIPARPLRIQSFF